MGGGGGGVIMGGGGGGGGVRCLGAGLRVVLLGARFDGRGASLCYACGVKLEDARCAVVKGTDSVPCLAYLCVRVAGTEAGAVRA